MIVLVAEATVNDWLQLPAAVIIISTFLAAIFALSRLRGLKETITILNMANEGLRATNDEQARKMVQNREALQAQLHAQDIECQRAIGELKGELGKIEGTVAFLQSNYVQDMVAGVRAQASEIITAMSGALTASRGGTHDGATITGENPVVVVETNGPPTGA